MVNKKAQDLSIGTLILIVLGIVVLVLLILGFSLGWSNLWEKIGIYGGTSSIGDIVNRCRIAETSQDKYTLCSETWEIEQKGGEIGCRDPDVLASLEKSATDFGCTNGYDPNSKVESSCKNLATACSAISAQTACTDQEGCTWNSAGNTPVCEGTAKACNTFDTENSCDDQEGCSWE